MFPHLKLISVLHFMYFKRILKCFGAAYRVLSFTSPIFPWYMFHGILLNILNDFRHSNLESIVLAVLAPCYITTQRAKFMGPTWLPLGSHVCPMNLAIRVWSTDARWRHTSESTYVQVMVCCLMAPKPLHEWMVTCHQILHYVLMNLISSMCSDIIFKILHCTKSGILTDIVSGNCLTPICRHAPIRNNDSP